MRYMLDTNAVSVVLRGHDGIDAKLSALQSKSGTPIGDFDEMIAAHALALDCVLVTDNMQHLKRVKGLQIENWARAA
jgi:predicted nucleic acid-binding protein